MTTMEMVRSANDRIVGAQLAALRLADTAGERLAASEGPRTAVLRWVWVVLIGILIIAAAVAFVWCRHTGFSGFTGNIEAVRGPFGIKIGIKIGCY